MLQEKRNLIEIVGRLSEVDVQEKSKKDSPNDMYIAGTITIKTHVDIDSVPTEVDIPISVYANKMTKKKQPNPVYDSIKSVMNNMTSIAACGDRDKASYVRVYQEKGGIRENSFYNKTTGALVQTVRLNGAFFNEVSPTKYPETAQFETDVFILAINDETDKEGNPTGRKIIKTTCPGYSGDLNNINYVVQNKTAIEHISSFWNPGDTVRVFGKFNYTTTVEKVTVEVGFGEPQVEQHSHTKKELLVTAGSAAGYDEEEAFSSEDITAGLQKRKEALEAQKENATAAPKKAAFDANSLGF